MVQNPWRLSVLDSFIDKLFVRVWFGFIQIVRGTGRSRNGPTLNALSLPHAAKFVAGALD
ncbi:hypothetical protein GGD61_008173 [Bradyrhizobium sp. SBR1B]|nr:hypothetical protein [Bradyrhizobium sp. SBR1B]